MQLIIYTLEIRVGITIMWHVYRHYADEVIAKFQINRHDAIVATVHSMDEARKSRAHHNSNARSNFIIIIM